METKHLSRIPFGQLAIIAMDNCRELGEKVNKHIVERRKKSLAESGQDIYLDEIKENYLVPVNNVRFANGRQGGIAGNSAGKDIYILSDVGNYSCTYKMFGITTHMGPDEHFRI